MKPHQLTEMMVSTRTTPVCIKATAASLAFQHTKNEKKLLML